MFLASRFKVILKQQLKILVHQAAQPVPKVTEPAAELSRREDICDSLALTQNFNDLCGFG